MVANPSPLLSIDEYLRTTYRPDCDFVDGEVEERNLGQYEHSTLQAFLAAWFWPHRDDWQVHTVTEQRVRVDENRVRIPDLCLLHRNAPREQVTETPPLLCIEISSPEDRLSRVTTRLDDFARMGVPHLWIIEPRERVAYTYTSPGTLNLITDRLTIPETPIYLDLFTLFAALD